MFHTRVVGAKTLEQLLLGEDLSTAGIGGYVSYVGRRSRRRQSKANQRLKSLQRRLLNDFISRNPLRRVCLLQGLAGGG